MPCNRGCGLSQTFAPPAAAAQPALDSCYQVETPEGIDLQLRPAGIVPRALAYTIDLLIRALTLLLLFILLAFLGRFGTGLGLILTFLITWWYMVLFEVLNQGRTPGKYWMGLSVVHDDGTPVGWSASLLRNLLRFVDILPFGYTLGLLSCLNHPAFKRLGDIAAGTLVVYRETTLSSRPPLPEAIPQRPPLPLYLDEQRALIAFAERHEQLSTARRQELAAIVSPLFDDADPVASEQALYGIAHGLLGPALDTPS
ncbi:RDD family protein [Pseudomonas fluvialis]|uniref:RDD family protein n=1 Tax=Pseudomonas fluvialis TaxID=1793966 RepID=UPI0035B43794